MKKRILSVTLAMAMIITLIASISIPVSAMKMNGFYVGVNELKDGVTYTNKSEGFSEIIKDDGGSITRTGNTITLSNVTINKDISVYNTEGDITGEVTIVLVGSNTIDTTENIGIFYSGYTLPDNSFPKFSIKSEGSSQGSLAITNGGIFSEKSNLSISNCKITAIGGIGALSGNITISNSKIDSTGTDIGIGVFSGNINIDKSNVTVSVTSTSDGSGGIQAYTGSINITDSNVTTADSCYYGLCAMEGNITISGGKVAAKASNISVVAISDTYDSLSEITTGKIILGSGTTVKNGGEIRTLDMIIEPHTAQTAQVIGNDTAKYDWDLKKFVNVATDVLICGTGTVSVQSQKPETIFNVTLPSDTDLQNAVLTDEDKAAMANGDNVNIQMKIDSVQAPSDSDKVQQSLGKNTLGMYLDISIIKTVGDTQTTVHNLKAPIRITFTIPENLRGKDKYYVIRVHDGVTTVLEDLDNDPNTVTFETDQFSTYALVYSTPSAKTNDNSNIIAMAVMGFSSLAAVAFIERKRF